MGQQKNCWPNAAANTIISRIGSPASAFFATERYMNLPQYDIHQTNHKDPIVLDDLQRSSYEQSGISVFLADSPQDSDGLTSSEKSYYTNPCSRLSEKEQILQLKRKLLGDSDDENKKTKPFLLPSVQGIQDVRVSCNFYGSHDLTQLKQATKPVEFVSVGSNCNKSRIRWTQELHDRFVKTVNYLGGENKATPKAILKMMDWEGLTIFHVKSHLQKCRNAKSISDYAEARRHERNSSTYTGVPIDNKTGMQIKEALQLQLDTQRRLHEQLELQRKLQVSIEEQGRQLKMMIDQQQKTANPLLETRNSNITSPISTALDDLEVVIPEIIENI